MDKDEKFGDGVRLSIPWFGRLGGARSRNSSFGVPSTIRREGAISSRPHPLDCLGRCTRKTLIFSSVLLIGFLDLTADAQ